MTNTTALTASKAQLTHKVVALIDAVQSAAPYGLTRGDINTAVRAAFSQDPIRDITSTIVGREIPTGFPLRRDQRMAAQRVMRAALNADQETLDALLWSEDVPTAVAA